MRKLNNTPLYLLVLFCYIPNNIAVIEVTLVGERVRHVCKGEDVDFKWTYDESNSDKDFIKTIQWSKDPSSYLIMSYETSGSVLTETQGYTNRVERTTEAGAHDIGMRLIDAGSTAVDDYGKYYVSLIVDKSPGDANDYFEPYRDKNVEVFVCVGVDDSYPLPSLTINYDPGTNTISCSGPSSLGDTTFAIFDPSGNIVVNSTTATTISKVLPANRQGGIYKCKTYCTKQGYNATPQGTCLPSDDTEDVPELTTPTAPPPPINITTPRSPCSPNPCKNGGTCYIDYQSENHFTCSCTKLFYGTTCQHQATPCSPTPCKNGGTCNKIQGEDNYQCICPEFYSGNDCSESSCSSNPCYNGATCTPTSIGFTCQCTGFYSGHNCTKTNAKDSNNSTDGPDEDGSTDRSMMGEFCSPPIRGGCLALIVIIVFIYVLWVIIYPLVLICFTFYHEADGGIKLFVKVILVILVIVVPCAGIFVAVYVYKKHAGTGKCRHSLKFFIFKCPCKCPGKPEKGNYKPDQANRKPRPKSPCSPIQNKVLPATPIKKPLGSANGSPPKSDDLYFTNESLKRPKGRLPALEKGPGEDANSSNMTTF